MIWVTTSSMILAAVDNGEGFIEKMVVLVLVRTEGGRGCVNIGFCGRRGFSGSKASGLRRGDGEEEDVVFLMDEGKQWWVGGERKKSL